MQQNSVNCFAVEFHIYIFFLSCLFFLLDFWFYLFLFVFFSLVLLSCRCSVLVCVSMYVFLFLSHHPFSFFVFFFLAWSTNPSLLVQGFVSTYKGTSRTCRLFPESSERQSSLHLSLPSPPAEQLLSVSISWLPTFSSSQFL